MHHLPQFFINNGEKRKKKTSIIPKKPKLERKNAMKNIDYEPPPTASFSSFSSEEEASVSAARRFDGSFRIDGSDGGQIDLICHSLGFDSPDDFGIPMASWQARKIRSASDLVPRSRLKFQFDHSPNVVENAEEAEKSEKVEACFCDGSFKDSEVVAAVEHTFENVRVSDCNRGGNGIKGARPPLLSPPSSSNLKPLMHNAAGSRWGVSRSSFAPLDGCALADVNQPVCGFSDGEEEAEIGTVRRRLGEGVLSESCSFTTSSNEDDSSSTTTEPTSSISPNGRFRRLEVTHWQKGELLGRGSFGSVYEGICDGGFFIAVKEVSLLDQGEQGRQSVFQLEQEIALLSQFKHENIVRYLGTDKDESKLYIFLELVTKGSLLSLYQKYHLRDSQVSAYTRQILHGLKYLHDRGVVHRDIKCANILVDANGSVKLADFGLAKATKFNDVRSCKGTAFWMAPEVVNQKSQGYGLAADIWSLGCTVLEMLTRQLPYSPMECMAALFKIGRNIPPPVPDSLSQEARDFILQCLEVDPSNRPTAAHLLDHPFVKRPLPLFSGSSISPNSWWQ